MEKYIPKIEFSIWERKLLLGLIDMLIVTVVLFFYFKVDQPELSFLTFFQEDYWRILYGLGLFWSLSIIFNMYSFDFTNITRKIIPLVFLTGSIFSLIYIFTPLITPNLPNKRIIILGFTIILILSLVFWRLFYIYFLHHPSFLKKIIVLVSENSYKEMIGLLNDFVGEKEANYGYRVKRIYKMPEDENENKYLENLLDKIITKKLVHKILIIDKNHEEISGGLNRVLVKSIQSGIEVETYLKFYEDINESLPINLAGKQFYNIFPISRSNTNSVYKLWSRINDIFSAVMGIGIMLLLMPFIGMANFFTSKGPLFYTQLRVGKGGEEYMIIKFRSMVVDAEKQGAKMSTKRDVRITNLGKLLRKTRIDELPQFLNVFMGDMSLIGPRPERKVFVDQLAENIPFYNARHMTKPGITGWAQVKYPYGEDLEDSYNKLEYDLYYIKNRSAMLDVRIILKTINSVIFSKGQ